MKITSAFKIFFSFISHPLVFLFSKGIYKTIIYPFCSFKGVRGMRFSGTSFGRHCSIKCFKVGKKYGKIELNECYVSDRAYISSGGDVSIEKTTIAPNVFIGSYKHDFDVLGSFPPSEDQNKIVIEEGCCICQNVSIFGNVHIGRCCVIGACSVVFRDIPAYSMVAGNPARIIKKYDLNKKQWVPIEKMDVCP